ncbi:MAG: WG repeat-containing protein [Bacillota bacterium]|nr:WG repeat-containing protein [Bacillota bacterium]
MKNKFMLVSFISIGILLLMIGCISITEENNEGEGTSGTNETQKENSEDTTNEDNKYYVLLTIPLNKSEYSNSIDGLKTKYDDVEEVKVDVEYIQLKIPGFKDIDEAEFQMYRIENMYPELKEKMVAMLLDYGSNNKGIYREYKNEKKGYIGYKDQRDRVIFSANFIEFKRFSEGISCVKVNYDDWMFLREDGSFISSKSYENMDSYSEGLAPVELNGKWGYVDYFENVKIDFDFYGARPFSERLAAIQTNENWEYPKWGYIDTSGGFVIEPAFIFVDSFSEGLAVAMKDGRGIGFIDKNGDFKIEPMYAGSYPFEDGKAMAYGINQHYLIDINGNIIESTNDTYDRKNLPVIENIEASDNVKNFVSELLEKIEQKDMNYLNELVSDDVKNGYESIGKVEFWSKWNLDSDPMESNLWDELYTIARIGFDNRNNSLLITPYYYNHFPEEYDDFYYGYVFENDVPIFLETNLNSEILDSYSKELIAYMHNFIYIDANGNDWNTVVLSDGRIGYINAQSVRKNIDYRATFFYNPEQDKWQLTSLMAGD